MTDTDLFIRALDSMIGPIRVDFLDEDLDQSAGLSLWPTDRPEATAAIPDRSRGKNARASALSEASPSGIVIEVDEADFAHLVCFPHPPSLVVQHRFNPPVRASVHAYWALEDPCEQEEARDVGGALAKSLGASGPSYDGFRGLPIPGTYHYLWRGGPAMEVRLIESNDLRYSAWDLWSASCPVGTTRTLRAAHEARLEGKKARGELPS